MSKINFSNNVNDLSVQVNLWRKFRKLKQRDLETMASLGHNSVSRIENGQVSPKLETIQKIAHALEISVEELQFRVPPKIVDEFMSDELNAFIERLMLLDEQKQTSLLQAFNQLLELIEE